MISPLPASSTHRARLLATKGAAGRALITLTLLAVPLVVSMIAGGGGTILALRVLAVASVAGGMALFLSHGGRRLSAAGLYSLASGLLAGCGAWYWARELPTVASRESILFAGLSLYALTAVMYLVFWRRSFDVERDDFVKHRAAIPTRRVASLRILGTLLFVTGAGAQQAGFALGGLPISAADVGLILFCASLLLADRVRLLQSPISTIAIGAAFSIYYIFVFTGGGRLRLATLLVATAIIAQYRLGTRIKGIALIALVPILVFFAAIGQDRVAVANPGVEASASGLGSLVNPLATFGHLIQNDITGASGSTFLAELTVVIPRTWWPDKPVQFGRVLALELQPHSIATNLSIPSVPPGEWYYNFSWPGILLMIPVLGFTVRWLDRRLARSNLRDLTSAHKILAFVCLAILAGSIGDLAWGGTATWANRNVQRLLILVPILVWSYILSIRERHPKDVSQVVARPQL